MATVAPVALDVVHIEYGYDWIAQAEFLFIHEFVPLPLLQYKDCGFVKPEPWFLGVT